MDYWIDGMSEKLEHVYQLTILKILLFLPSIRIFLSYIIFFLIILLIEIDLTNDIKSPIRDIGKMMFTHLPGMLILVIYCLYNFAWAEYHLRHYLIVMVKEFKFFHHLIGILILL